MALSLNRYLDQVRMLILSYAGDPKHCLDLQRSGDSYQDFVLSASQMDTLNATAVTVLAAPGTGLVNIVKQIVLYVNSTGLTAFELGSGVLEFRYADASGSKVVTDVPNATVESATDIIHYAPGIVCNPLANTLVCAHASADVTAGTGNIQGRIFYKTIKQAEIVA